MWLLLKMLSKQTKIAERNSYSDVMFSNDNIIIKWLVLAAISCTGRETSLLYFRIF